MLPNQSSVGSRKVSKQKVQAKEAGYGKLDVTTGAGFPVSLHVTVCRILSGEGRVAEDALV